MTKVSVVIPVYGAEEYIAKCARSLFGQTLPEMEYIFIDDCSPDRSIAILEQVMEEFPQRKEQVNIIRHETNRGVSASRQEGVDAATGEYTIHCDPDDWIDPEMYAIMYAAAKGGKYDMVLCDFHPSETREPEEISSLRLLQGIAGLAAQAAHGGLCSKLVKTSLLHKHRFPEGVSYCEDVNYLAQLLRQPLRILHLHRPFYHYNYHLGSLCSVKSLADLDRDDRNIASLLALKAGQSPDYARCIDNIVLNVIYHRAYLSRLLSDREFKARYAHLDAKKYVAPGRMQILQVRLAMAGHATLARKLNQLRNLSCLRLTAIIIAQRTKNNREQ